jgi:hypothetical protein
LTASREDFFSLVYLTVTEKFLGSDKTKIFSFARIQGRFVQILPMPDLLLCRVTISAGVPTTNPLVPSVMRASSLLVKWPGREANHSVPYLAEVKNAWAIFPLFHMSR